LTPRLEPDYVEIYDRATRGEILAGTSIEIIREPRGRGSYRHALFDFDGTLSLIREGWQHVMVPMMVEAVMAAPNHESEEEVEAVVREFVTQLTGKQTIYQMLRLCDEISRRGGSPLPASDYKQEYLRRLDLHISSRKGKLRSGEISREDMVVPGSVEILHALTSRGVQVYLASGTDQSFVTEEAELLGLAQYAGRRIYGALEDYQNSSKAVVIQRILAENDVRGESLLGFGDAYVEIENVKSVGGTGVGVASDEVERSGKPDPWKRDRLVGIGADIIVPDFRESPALIGYLFPVCA
jgi:phosphoglycolate phosphatase-like HAD superfamily hydrolase